jgi:hypothetical protein
VITLTEIKAEVDRRAAIIAVPESGLPTYGHSEGWAARPHIEVDERGYHYVVMERGNELKRITTNDLDDLLYQVFCDTTSQLASEYEVPHRVEEQDNRRMMFDHQIETLARLSPDWAARQKDEIDQILQEYPYGDAVEARQEGQLLSRIGKLNGVFAAPPGTSVGARALPASCADETETVWEVMKPFEMQRGLAAPWGGAPGLGVQYLLPRSVETLKRTGFIRCLRSGPVDKKTKLTKFFENVRKRIL